MQDLIFVSLENWDEVWRRNQFLCSGLAKRHPSCRILFVGLPRDISHYLRHGRLSEVRGEATWSAPGFRNITVTRPLKLAPNSLGWGRRLNEIMARMHVRGVARRLRMRNFILWLNPHDAVHMAGRMGERALLYDITDDWTKLTQPRVLTDLITSQDAELCRRAGAVIVCSQRLFDLKRDLACNLHLIPNGVDAEHYRCVLDSVDPLPEDAAHWPKPVLGYTGTIHPDRVDLALVETLARQLPGGSIVLIGPNHLPPIDQVRLESLGNILFKEAVPYNQLPAYMRAFDVCITPHRVTPFTESLNPLKLWEYLAAGKPIISTNVAGFRDYPDLVRIADVDGFLSAVQDALREGPAKQEARRSEARRHSWDARINAVESVMRSCSASRTQETTSVC